MTDIITEAELAEMEAAALSATVGPWSPNAISPVPRLIAEVRRLRSLIAYIYTEVEKQ